MVDLRNRIETLWEGRHDLSVDDAEANETIREAIDLLDSGEARVAETDGEGGFLVNKVPATSGSARWPPTIALTCCENAPVVEQESARSG